MVVIFAGYPKEMEKLLDSNPGLRSRIAFHVNFENYSPDELSCITDYIASSKCLHFNREAKEKLHSAFEIVKDKPDFGNGHYVRNAIEQSRLAQASRLMHTELEKLTPEDIVTITAEDIVIPDCSGKSESKAIGFCA